MNLYICSTLRHLLFSLARASSSGDIKSIIVFFNDYQKIDVDSINTECLPDNIKLILLERTSITKNLKKSLIGKLLLASSVRGLPYNKVTAKLLANKLSNLTNLNSRDLLDQDLKLYLFNDKNKMSRLFKLLNSSYEIIEDGVGNYIKVKVIGIKRYIRLLLGKPKKFWVFGESPRCKKIYVTYPEKLPEEVKHKGCRIDFLKSGLDLELVNQVFKFTPKMKENNCVIIATQPKSKRILPLLSGDDVFILAYKKVEEYYVNSDIQVQIKLHPSEDISNYNNHFHPDKFLSTKHPLELELINNPRKKTTIISINSSAGLGFEEFCVRKTLTKDGDIDDFIKSVVLWQDSEEAIEESIHNVLG
ncbi:hypothetical protein A143_09445 [Vibrio splendidus ZS-139]|nr:hypothetical protein A143_09445 [Vibrio splendidus ZS-139]